MLLADLVAAADAVASVGSRNAKVELLAAALSRADADEIVPAVCALAGEARQGRIGVGWATIAPLRVRAAAVPTLTVTDLDRALEQIQRTTGAGSAEARSVLLRDVLGRATAPEQDFIRRLLVGELRQGALEGVMTEAIARAAGVASPVVRRALMLSGDLGRTAGIAIAEGEEGLRAIGLTVGRAVLPMLASTAEDVAEAVAITGRASVEWKLDGIRIQVHRAGDEVHVFTRNLNDITERVPEIAAVVQDLPGGDLILDGEAIVLDEGERPQAFQETMSRLGRRTGAHEALAVPWFFDVLHAGGEDLIDRPLAERIQALERIAGRMRIPSTQTDDPEDARAFLEGALEAGHEGVVVKALSSPYAAGRRGKAWVKVKPVTTLDLVVLGAEWGHGRRRGWLSNLHLGARGPDGGFVMVGKTFKGLTDELLRWQTEQLLAREVRRDGIVVFVRPELVIEIELDGVQTSTRYPGGVALRFARVLRYRHDKRPDETDTIDAVRDLLGS